MHPWTRAIPVVCLVAVVLVPLVWLEGVYRFVLLPEVLVLQVAALVAGGLWFWHGTWKPSPLVLPVLLFFLAEVVSIGVASNRVVSLLPVATHAAYVLFFLAALNTLKKSDLDIILRAAAIVAAGISVLGLVQFFGWHLLEVPTAGFPSATLGHRNLAAAYLVAVLPFTFWAWVVARRTWSILLWGGVVGLELAFLIATRSRAGWVGVVGAVFLVVAASGWQNREALAGGVRQMFSGVRVAALALGLALTIVPIVVPARIEKGAGEAMWEGKRSMAASVASVVQQGGDRGRISLWRRTLEMIAAQPIMGVGAGNWRLQYPLYAQGDMVDEKAMPHRPHSDPLWIWSEMGTLGLAAYLFLLWMVSRIVWRLLSRPKERLLAGTLLCSMAAAVICSTFGFSREFPGAWLPFYVSLAGLGVLDTSGISRRRAFLRPVVCVGLLGLVAGLWITLRQVDFDRYALQLRVVFEADDWHEVVRTASHALAVGPFDEEVFLMRARAYEAMGSPAKAEVDYRRGLSYHAASVGLWNGLGNALRLQGDGDGARASYEHALVLDPESAAAYNNIGTLHAVAGNLDSAKAAYLKAVDYQKNLVDGYANLSVVYRKMGDVNQAMEVAWKALYREPEHLEALNALGGACMVAGRFDEAAQAFSRAIGVDPSRAELYFNLGRASERRGDVKTAIVAYEAFLQHWKGGPHPQVETVKMRVKRLRADN
ncbi:MAG: tetratricopeptide repeat protein [bacterium]|nr:tetratricopeptide repeat protein [bacterium]